MTATPALGSARRLSRQASPTVRSTTTSSTTGPGSPASPCSRESRRTFASATTSSCPGADLRSRGSGKALSSNCYWTQGGGFAVDDYRSLADWAAATGQETLAGAVVGLNVDPQIEGHPGTALHRSRSSGDTRRLPSPRRLAADRPGNRPAEAVSDQPRPSRLLRQRHAKRGRL